MPPTLSDAGMDFQTGDTDGSLQSTPLVIDGVMYISTAHNWCTR